MNIRLLKHYTINGVQHFAGTMLPLSAFDKILENGDLIYHHDEQLGTWERIRASDFKIVYSSYSEMEAWLEAPRLVKELKLEVRQYQDEIGDLKRQILRLEHKIERLKDEAK